MASSIEMFNCKLILTQKRQYNYEQSDTEHINKLILSINLYHQLLISQFRPVINRSLQRGDIGKGGGCIAKSYIKNRERIFLCWSSQAPFTLLTLLLTLVTHVYILCILKFKKPHFFIFRLYVTHKILMFKRNCILINLFDSFLFRVILF